MNTSPRAATKAGAPKPVRRGAAEPSQTEPKKQATDVGGVEIAATKNNVLRWQPRALEVDPEEVRAFGPVAPAPAVVEEAAEDRYAAETDYPELAATYWNDPRIHTFGNVGRMGAVHAVVAPAFTAALDAFAYGGVDTRSAACATVASERAALGSGPVTCAIDVGTGTGSTARALAAAFAGADVTGVDTSPEMLRAARDLTCERTAGTDCAYVEANAEATGLARGRADLVTAFFLLHEAPAAARRRILDEARALCGPGGTIAVCDIHPGYEPSPMMLAGEPYINGYLDSIEREATAYFEDHGFAARARSVIYESRLVMWTFHLPV